MKRILFFTLSTLLIASAWAETPQVSESLPSDTLARVGDEVITFSQLNTQLNSTAVVGLSTPALGTPERSTAMLTLLDKAISANLLYLDAVKAGRQEHPQFKRELRTFSDGLLVGLYRKHYLSGGIEVSDQEVEAYFGEHFLADAELTERLRLIIRAKIRNNKLAEREAGLRAKLRNGLRVNIYPEKLEPDDDHRRAEQDILAEFGDRRITWGEARAQLTTRNSSVDLEHRLETLEELLDHALMAERARQAGLDKDPSYEKRRAEFSKTRLINFHRGQLISGMEPSEQELHDYYAKHQDRIAVKERRKLQMVVLPDKAQAESVKARIDQGELTLFQAAQDHSIDPRAKQTLGDFGWVEQGSGFPALDTLAFSLAPGELGGPVQSPAGWHLVLVTDQRPPAYLQLDSEDTRDVTRRLLLKERLNDYVVGLRQGEFPVVVYEDKLRQLFHKEAQWIAAKSQEAERNPEKIRQLLEAMRH